MIKSNTNITNTISTDITNSVDQIALNNVTNASNTGATVQAECVSAYHAAISLTTQFKQIVNLNASRINLVGKNFADEDVKNSNRISGK